MTAGGGNVGFGTVLVANRGEIAVRILRTLRRLGVRSVAVHSDADADAPHVRQADVAVRIGGTAPADSYLHVERVVTAALDAGADAIHPGYGFLSERPALAQACADAGVVFVGPPAAAIEAMGDKARARALMRAAGVPVVPGTDEGDLDDGALVDAAARIGLPLMVKPVAGGGGTGMVVVRDAGELPGALETARRRAAAAFGDDRLLLERFVAAPRHVEVQVLADGHGVTLHLGERECSLQRRHQKIVEESPSPLLDDATRGRLTASAVEAARACGYRGAGTVELLVPAAEPDRFHFLEMNTRLQVEHPVTELRTGIDLVEWQLRIAAGQALPWAQDQITASGHAVEARINAEDPARGFLPTGGTVVAFVAPSGPGVRVDAGVATGTAVPTAYDSLLAKVIAHGADRDQALRRLERALGATVVLGVQTNVGLVRRVVAHPDVRAAAIDTGWVERHVDELRAGPPPDHVLAAAALGLHVRRARAATGPSAFDRVDGWRLGARAWTPVRLGWDGGQGVAHVRGRVDAAEVTVGGHSAVAASATLDGPHLRATVDGRTRRYAFAEDGDVVWIAYDGDTWALRRVPAVRAGEAAAADGGPLTAPMPGTVTAVHVADGDAVTAGQTLVVMEAMKMEHRVTAPADGMVGDVAVHPGDTVELDRPLLTVTPAETPHE